MAKKTRKTEPAKPKGKASQRAKAKPTVSKKVSPTGHRQFLIIGQIKDPQHPDRVEKLRIDALAKGAVINHPFGSDVTDGSGNFRIQFSEKYMLDCFPINRPNFFFRVYCKDLEIAVNKPPTVTWPPGKDWPPKGTEIRVTRFEVTVPDECISGPPEKIYHILGQVTDTQHADRIGGLRLEAWADRNGALHLFGSDVTTAQGSFHIRFSETYLRERFPAPEWPEFFFKAFCKNLEITMIEPPVIIRPSETEIRAAVRLTVPDDCDLDGGERFIVKGHVRQADCSPLVGAKVRVVDRDMRSETLLGEKTTDNLGYYELPYTAEQFSHAEKPKARADLIVYVLKPDGTALDDSKPIRFNAGKIGNVEVIDIKVGGGVCPGPSEYELLIAELTPLLENIPIADLTDDDIAFLTGETGINAISINFLVIAANLSAETDLDTAVFYGLFRQNLPTDLPGLLSQSSQTQRTALETALDNNIIPFGLRGRLDQIIQRLQELIVDQAFKEEPGRTSLGALLGTALTGANKQRMFLTLFVTHQGTTEEFWDALRQNSNFNKRGLVDNLQFALQVGALSNNHLPMVQALQERRQSGALPTTRSLATLDVNGWLQIINSTVNGQIVGFPPDIPGANDEEKKRNYVAVLMQITEDAFPTAVIAAGIGRENSFSGKTDLVTFLNNPSNSNFEFGSTILSKHLAENSKALYGVDDVEGTKKQLISIQRLSKLTPKFNEIRVLLTGDLGQPTGTGFGATAVAASGQAAAPAVAQAAPIDSAQAITNMGQSAFVTTYGAALGGTERARAIYNDASLISALTSSLFVDHGAQFNRINGTFASYDPPAAQGAPDLEALFDSLDTCQCEQCRSVHSPAAYLVDILSFLNQRDSKIVGKPAKWVLFERRPEIGEIELSCQNTNTPLPYVDLVNEVLENAVAPLSDEERKQLQTRGAAAELSVNPEHVNPEAYDKLARAVYPWNLPFDLWAEEARVFLNHLGVPRHELMKTFRKRNGTVAPSELAIANEHLGLTRFESRVVTGGLSVRAATTKAITTSGLIQIDGVALEVGDMVLVKNQTIAAENGIYIAQTGGWRRVDNGLLSPGLVRAQEGATNENKRWLLVREEDQTLSVTEAGPWEFWGLEENGNEVPDPLPGQPDHTIQVEWKEALKRVRVFLDRSGLSYQDLEDLLQLRFVDPNMTIRIAPRAGAANVTCDTAELEIQGLDEAAANRIHRFLRLWRKLGWIMRDLDKAITALSPSDLNGSFLRQLSHIKRMQTMLNLPIDRVLAFRAEIDSNGYIDYHAAGRPIAPSLYARLFRNRAVIDPLDPDFPDDPAQLTGKLSEQIPTITAALGISAADFDLLFHDNNIIPPIGATGAPDDKLSLDYLSRLYRHATLAKALRLRMSDYLSALGLINSSLFASTGETVLFIEQIAKTRESGFSIAELDYLLRHQFNESSGVAPKDDEIALIFDEIRGELQKIAAENTFIHDPVDPTKVDPTDPSSVTTDPEGAMTEKKLAMLNLDSEVIKQAIAEFKGTAVFETPLDQLAKGIVFPERVRDRIAYDKTAKKLRFIGVMTLEEKTTLTTLPNADDPFKTAVEKILFKAPRTFILRNLRSFSVPAYAEKLDDLSDDLKNKLRNSLLKQKIYYDTVEKELHFTGAMTKPELLVLLNLAGESEADVIKDILFIEGITKPELEELLMALGDKPYQKAVIRLFARPNTDPEPEDIFLTASDVSQFFDAADGPEGKPMTPERRFNAVLEKLMNYLRPALSERAVKQKLGEVLKLESKTADGLLTKRLHLPGKPDPLIAEFLDDPFAKSNRNEKLSRTAFEDQFRAFTLLHKAALIISKFIITSKQLEWLFDHRSKMGAPTGDPTDAWLDFNSLPLVPLASGAALFVGWERLVDLFRLRDQLPGGESLLTQIFMLARTSGAGLLEELSKQTQWSLIDLKFLVGAQGFDFAFPDAFKDEAALAQLRDCFVTLKRLGMPAEQSRDLAAADLSEERARGVRQAARTKYDETQWLEVAKPLRDLLREKQRAALVAWLIANPKRITPSGGTTKSAWLDANDLYAYFLIDVEMSPCQITSRIKQAISSAQLFTQRCLMNLEPDVTANSQADEDWLQWKWMKNYRVWEANRKIFLYPENWIEPELRDDKTPFFKDLENELLQNEVTMETAENAFLHYLEKLDAVARLEIAGMYHQQDSQDGTDILHVFGRTHSTPHVYFYRRRIDSAYWTPWEKMDLDIEGDHLIPIVWNRRLHLFWPVFREKAIENQGVPPANENTQPTAPSKYWEIQITWSKYQNKKWAPKKISKEVVTTQSQSPQLPDKNLFYFEPGFDETGDLIIFVNFITPPTPNLHILSLSAVNAVPTFFFSVNIPAGFRLSSCQEKVVILNFNGSGTLKVLPGTSPEFMTFVEDQGSDHPLVLLVLPSFGSIIPSHFILNSVPVFGQTPGRFLVRRQHFQNFDAQALFFYADDARTYFVIPEDLQPPVNSLRFGDSANPITIDSIGKNYYKRSGVPSFGAVATAGRIIGEAMPQWSVSAEDVATPGAHSQSLLVGNGAQAGGRAADGDGGNTRINITNTGLSIYHPETLYDFQPFYHPYVCLFIRELNRLGIDGLLQRAVQRAPINNIREPHKILSPPTAFDFRGTYKPEFPYVRKRVVKTPYPVEDVDFTYGGAYSQYNWELFFHAPLLIADRLGKNQRFEEAQKWFHYIFDPTDTSGYSKPQRYWRTRQFFDTADTEYRSQQIQRLLEQLASGNIDQKLKRQVEDWRDRPFNPHLIARLRTVAYQKTVVMKYLDNLIAWGDQLFRRDTIESINEATQLYILAAEILGRRPENIPPRLTAPVETYNTLESKLSPNNDSLNDPFVELENYIPQLKLPGSDSLLLSDGAGSFFRRRTVTPPPPPPPLRTLYFCVPQNDKLLSYWDTVADRLFKIRHCLNIEGMARQLPLFEPPIDPALLVKAAAAGVDISSALSDINAALPHYRFNVMAQKASELCSELKALGGALLSALEKHDAEALALLRSTHEIKMLNAVRQVKEKQIEEAKQALEGFRQTKKVTEARRDYYRDIKKTNAWEDANLFLTSASLISQIAATVLDLVAGGAHVTPTFTIGVSGAFGSPVATVKYGGENVGRGAESWATFAKDLSGILATGASLSATVGGHERRWDDWKLQEKLANLEIEQVDKQIAAGEIRLAVAEQELKNHDLQIENAKEVDEFMRDKFTNRELYDWMVGQLSAVYFQSYQLAYDVAKRAERAYRHELGLTDSSFIQFGYWDSLKKGLLAGERLHHDIKRMEVAYLDQNKREYEITRNISLATLDPVALLRLRETGECFVDLHETFFDMDYPGHYLRRIKSVSLTVPCVTGPYTSANCTLTLLSNSLRRTTSASPQYTRNSEGDDPRFADNIGAIQSIATSGVQNDSGMFELNFRDERYLPFEGAGAISRWRIELPIETNQFDRGTISDVVIHLRYMAREGGAGLKAAALDSLPMSGARLFSLRHEFPTAWHRFLHPDPASNEDQALEVNLTADRFPFRRPGRQIKITAVEMFGRFTPEDNYEGDYKAKLTPLLNEATEITMSKLAIFGGLHHGVPDLGRQEKDPGNWKLRVKREGVDNYRGLPPTDVDDIFIVCFYRVASE